MNSRRTLSGGGGGDTCGAHGYDNAAPEMRALFMARGPAFRKDGARLVGRVVFLYSPPRLRAPQLSSGSDFSFDTSVKKRVFIFLTRLNSSEYVRE